MVVYNLPNLEKTIHLPIQPYTKPEKTIPRWEPPWWLPVGCEKGAKLRAERISRRQNQKNGASGGRNHREQRLLSQLACGLSFGEFLVNDT